MERRFRGVFACISCLAILSLVPLRTDAAQNSSHEAMLSGVRIGSSLSSSQDRGRFDDMSMPSATGPAGGTSTLGVPGTTGSSTPSSSSAFLVAPAVSISGAPTAVAVGDLNNDGKLDFVVANSSAAAVTVFLGKGNGNFQAAVNYPVGENPSSVAMGDFNGDGKLDVAVANQTGNTVSVLLGNGDGTLQKAVNYKGVSGPVYLVAGDFNGNGHPDLAVANGGNSSISVLLNKGDGTFEISAAPYKVGAVPQSITVADFNGDGHLDLASANSDGTVSIFRGKGKGAFQPASSFSVGSARLSSVVAGDFNGDGKPDLAVANPSARTVSVLLGNGDGTFQTGMSYPVGNSPAFLVVGDVNGDGAPDLLSANESGNTVSVLLGNGNGTFQTALDFTVGNSPVALAVGDFNGDGHSDLVTANFSDHTLSVPLGNGDGTFAAARDYSTELERKSVASGDLDGDGTPDLVVTNFCGTDSTCASNGTASVLLNNGDGTFKPAVSYSLGKGPVSVVLADLNGDKNLDLIAANWGDNTVSVLLGNGDGTFRSALSYAVGNAPVSVVVGDFNKDGKMDLAVADQCGSGGCAEAGDVSVLLGNGDGSFQPAVSYRAGFSPSSIAEGDLNGDSKLDLVVANTCGKDNSCAGNGTATVLLGKGDGTFNLVGEAPLGIHPSSVTLGDLNGDGKPDLVVANKAQNNVGVLLGNGDGTFKDQVVYSAGASPSSVIVADFNHDGKLDIAVANVMSSTVSLLWGNGDGTLQTAVHYPVGLGPESLVAADLKGQGHTDLVSANGNGGSALQGNDVTVLMNIAPAPPKTKTTTTVTSSVNPSVVNQSVTFTATVTSTGGTPTGTVSFTADTKAISGCTGVPLSGGKAECTTATLALGSHTIKATYSGDANFSGSSGTLTQVVNQATTTTTVASSVNPSVINQPVIFTATVTPEFSGTINPTGTVSFTADGKAIAGCTKVPLSGGTAKCTTATLILGSHAIKATYSGDKNFKGSSGTLTQVVNQATTTTTVTSSVNPSVINQPVTFTATVKPEFSGAINPTGTVSFTADTIPIPGCTNVPLSGGTAECTTATLALGSHAIKATYSGDANFSGSSGTLTQVVKQATTTTTVASSVNPSVVNQPVTFTATVTPEFSGTTNPTGTVTFTSDGAAISGCTGVPLSGGTAKCTTSTLPPGSHTIKAAYSGDKNFIGSTGTLTQVVNQATTKTTVVSSVNPSVINQSVTFTATVKPEFLGNTNPTGTVSFTADGTAILGCTGVSLSGGTANCTTATLTLGSRAIKATYSGDKNFTGSSGTLTQVVNQATTTTAVASSVNPSVVNQPVTFTATVTPEFSGTTDPTGTVSFTADGTAISGCTGVPLSGATAKCTTATLILGSHTIKATYSGDKNFIGSSGTLTQVVNKASTMTALAASPNINQSITFTATVTPAFSGATNPTATVTFMDGATKLGTGTLDSAAQAHITSALAPGTHSISATYGGDANFTSSTSNALTLTFTQLATLGPVIAGSPTNAVTLTDTASTGNTTVKFSCLSIVQGTSTPKPFTTNPNDTYDISCQFNQTSPTTAALTICTLVPSGCTGSGTFSALRRDQGRRRLALVYEVTLGVPGMVFLGLSASSFGRRRRRLAGQRVAGIWCALVLVPVLLFLASCGGGFPGTITNATSQPGTAPAGNYSLTITAEGSDGSVQVYTVPFIVLAPN